MSGIYIHIPFCKKACHYCDFHFSTSLEHKTELVTALQKELKLRSQEAKQCIETIYFGGGTPSMLSPKELENILDSLYQNYPVSNQPEITFEMNPEDITTSYLSELKKLNINRISVGIQSFFDQELIEMNRTHNASQAKSAMRTANRFFENISLDLIYGFPKMTNERWLENVSTALAYKPSHLSAYALTVEPKTALNSFIQRKKYPSLIDKLTEKHYFSMKEVLESKAYIHYETSNFGKKNYFSRANCAYWSGKSYIGVGPSAHSFDGKNRSYNVSNNLKYISSLMKNKRPSRQEILTDSNRYNEYILTGLRTMWGVDLEKIATNFGTAQKNYVLKAADKYLKTNLMLLDQNHLKITPKALLLIDGICADLFDV